MSSHIFPIAFIVPRISRMVFDIILATAMAFVAGNENAIGLLGCLLT